MKLLRIPFAIMLLGLLVTAPPLAYAGGNYRVDRDEGGIFLQTDEHGGWYIAPEDRDDFKVGQTGTYRLRQDNRGTYILIDQRQRYYLGEDGPAATAETRGASSRETKPVAPADQTTPVVIHGNHVLVPVTIAYQNREIEVLLLLDTGASVITLHKDVADRLRLPRGFHTRLLTAGGRKIDAGLVKLGRVAFGPFQRTGLAAAVIRNRNAAAEYHGLLGMNALRGIDFKIDHTGRQIHWGS
ncbi:MAG: retropepsin-like aspartic protease [Desulfobacterales bacterium]